jgi:protein-S-isoprenylcysteine O-methyltransferase Ste14
MRRVLYWLDLPVFLVCAAAVYRYSSWNLRAQTGFALALAGFVLWIAARLQLGRSFAVTAQAKKLVTHGLYSKFRHPVYTFSILGYLGLAIAWWKWAGFAWLVAMWLGQMARMRKEEAVLERAFGEDYRRYRAATWM